MLLGLLLCGFCLLLLRKLYTRLCHGLSKQHFCFYRKLFVRRR